MIVSDNFKKYLLSSVITKLFTYSFYFQGIYITGHPKAYVFSTKGKNNTNEIKNLSNFLRNNIRKNHKLSQGKNINKIICIYRNNK